MTNSPSGPDVFTLIVRRIIRLVTLEAERTAHAVTGTDMSETGQNLKREAAPVLVYFAVYLTYLFVRPESEFLHWLTLVLLPFLAVYGLRRSWLPDATFNATLHSIGFRRSVLKKGLIAALLLGVALNGLQLVISQRRDEIWEVLSSPAAFVTLPLIFLLLLL